MHLPTTPHTIIATIISLYWTCVLFMSLRSRIAFRVPSGSLPKTKLERVMWLVWVPTITAWIILAWRSDNGLWPVLTSAGMTMVASAYWMAIWIATVVAVVAFLLTVRCWLSMGRNWSMAVRPDKQTELITTGPFSRVRHPIYALSLVLMVCTLVVAGSWRMAIVASLHISLLVLKSINEERYLITLHGTTYQEYLDRTRRFMPCGMFKRAA